MTEWPTNYEDLKESLRNTKIPAHDAEAFAAKLKAHLLAIPAGLAKEEEHTLWSIFESCILSPSTPDPAPPLTL